MTRMGLSLSLVDSVESDSDMATCRAKETSHNDALCSNRLVLTGTRLLLTVCVTHWRQAAEELTPENIIKHDFNVSCNMHGQSLFLKHRAHTPSLLNACCESSSDKGSMAHQDIPKASVAFWSLELPNGTATKSIDTTACFLS